VSDTATDIAPSTGDASAKETPGSSAGTGSDAPDTREGQDSAGGSQDSSAVGQDSANSSRQRGPSKLDTIRELRARLREERSQWQEQTGNLQTRLDQLEARFKSGNGSQKPSKTFWEAPEEVLDERISGHLSEMEKRIMENFQQSRTVDQQTSEWKSETSEAEKFIKTQKGFTPDDEEDLADIVRSTPLMMQLRPMDRAKYALFLWKEQKGITDKSDLKSRASTVVGSPPNMNGLKEWTNTEIENAVSKFPPDPRNWSDDDRKKFDVLDGEIRRAYRENRVKK